MHRAVDAAGGRPLRSISWINFLLATNQAEELSGAMLQGLRSRIGLPKEYFSYLFQSADA